MQSGILLFAYGWMPQCCMGYYLSTILLLVLVLQPRLYDETERLCAAIGIFNSAWMTNKYEIQILAMTMQKKKQYCQQYQQYCWEVIYSSFASTATNYQPDPFLGGSWQFALYNDFKMLIFFFRNKRTVGMNICCCFMDEICHLIVSKRHKKK